MKQTILLTGGLGYVGGRVSRFLAGQGFNTRLGTRGRAVSAPAWCPSASVVQTDFASPESLDHACKGADCIIHLAAMNEIDSANDPVGALEVNGTGTLKVLRSAERMGAARFIHLSTAHVYGAPLAGRITEESLPRPVHPYAITHRAAEDFVLAAHDGRRLTGITVRLSNGFGAPVVPSVNRWTLLVNDLCRQAVEGRALALKSSGVQQRDFITLEDVGRAIAHLIELPPDRCGNGLFNLGGETSISVAAMTERVAARSAAVLGFTPAIERPPALPGEASVALDYRIDKLKATGFALTGDFDAEIDATLRLCKEAFGAAR
ncbi:MAG: SDR family oxidoreductase [Deltaproteobacteria bacterium]|nr:SDR family oxidoreductase [Deltaproteobacteria bacterium]